MVKPCWLKKAFILAVDLSKRVASLSSAVDVLMKHVCLEEFRMLKSLKIPKSIHLKLATPFRPCVYEKAKAFCMLLCGQQNILNTHMYGILQTNRPLGKKILGVLMTDWGHAVACLVETLRQKSEGHGLRSLDFSVYLMLLAALWPWGRLSL
jgi:hypothetical protein